MIRVEPSGAAFEVEEGETIMAAALRSGFTWPTICGGQGNCKTCVFLILEGDEHLAAAEPWEQEGLQSIAHTLPNGGKGFRLACQAKLLGKHGGREPGDVRLKKIGVRPAPV